VEAVLAQGREVKAEGAKAVGLADMRLENRDARHSSEGPPGGGELHLTITALRINGLPGVNDTINAGSTSLTLSHGFCRDTDEKHGTEVNQGNEEYR